jgi:chromosome segregation ATPase
MHYQNDIVDQLIEIHGKCPDYVAKLMISLKAVEYKFLEIRNKVEAVSDSKNSVISNLEQRQMQLSAELVHQRQQKQGLNLQLALLQKLLGEREGSVKQLSEQLFTREKEVILAKHQRNKLKKTINALEEQFEKFAKH